jgi:plastocyanin
MKTAISIPDCVFQSAEQLAARQKQQADHVRDLVAQQTAARTSGLGVRTNRPRESNTTFTQAGSFPYFCRIHGKASMSGTVLVQ